MPGGAGRRRKRQPKPVYKRGLVVAEGIRTEPQYVEGLGQHLR